MKGIKKEQGKWKIKVTKTINGKRVYRRATASTKAEAERTRDRLQSELEALATPTVDEPPTNTLFSWSVVWMKKKQMHRKASTLKTYREALVNHILPEVGHVPLEEFSRSMMDDFARTIERKTMSNGEPYSIATVKGWWRITKIMVQDAHAEGLLESDPMYRVQSPETQRVHIEAGPKREQEVLDVHDLRTLCAAVRDLHPHRYAEVATLAWTGMRPGEMYALEWSDIDFDRQEIRISKSVWNGIVGVPKTTHPRRVPMNDVVADALREQELVERDFETELVFPSNTGTYRGQWSLTKIFRAVERNTDIGIKIGCQVIRRSFNTMLRTNGTHDNVIRAIMGHATPSMTYRYDGVPNEDKLAAVALASGSVETEQN